jgi:UDP-3-O-[3-hydroxymyristoyl] glucosamine N-acyltransferase
VATVDLTEPQRRRLWRAARAEGDESLARRLAFECPTYRGLTDLACPCHSYEKDGTIIHPRAYVEGVVGPRTRIGPMACIGPLVTVGADCVIGPGAVLGWEGFGYSRDGMTDQEAREHGTGEWELKDQRYGVILGDGVHVGALTCVDRGSYRDTRIAHGTKIDNLVHVAHNVIIGQRCLVIAQAMLGGSVEIGDDSWIAPHAVIREHIKIGSRAFVALGAVVVKDVEDGESVKGCPAKVFQPGAAESPAGA